MSSRRRHLLLALALAATALLVTSTGWPTWPSRALRAATRPLQAGLVGAPRDDDADAALREQLLRLNAENIQLRSRLAEYDAIRGEGGIPPNQVVVVRARVQARTSRLGRRYLELDAGAADGVVKGMAACAGWSLAGLVVGVREGSCLVQLVSDSESRIPAAVIDSSERLAEGILTGTGSSNALILDFIEDRAGLRLAPGMGVVTAGSDGRLPPGLVLGTIQQASRGASLPTGGEHGRLKAELTSHWEIRVAPQRNLEALDSLLILRFATPER